MSQTSVYNAESAEGFEACIIGHRTCTRKVDTHCLCQGQQRSLSNHIFRFRTYFCHDAIGLLVSGCSWVLRDLTTDGSHRSKGGSSFLVSEGSLDPTA
jgi:hypothetical protein